MRSLLLAGYFGYGNLGDEAILAAMAAELRKWIPDSSLMVLSGDPSDTRERHSVPAISVSDLNAIIAAISGADLLVLGGGGIFHDKWGISADSFLTPDHSGLTYLAGLVTLAHLSGTPVITYGVGMGPFLTEQGKRFTEAILSHCSMVTVRDKRSARLAADLMPTDSAGLIKLVADPALVFDIHGTDAAFTDRSRGKQKVVGVAVRHWIGSGVQDGWEDELASALDKLAQDSRCQIHFLPMQSNPRHVHEDDVLLSNAVRAAMKHKQAVDAIEPVVDLPSLVKRMQALDCILAMRYHSLLFALRLGIPVVAMAYDEKVRSLASDAGVDGVVLEPVEWKSGFIYQSAQRAIDGTVSPTTDLSDLYLRAAETGKIVSRLRTNIPAVRELHPLLADLLSRHLSQSASSFNAESRVEHLRAQRDSLMVQRNRLQLELESLRATAGVRWLQHYWDVMRRWIPEGSRRRELYFLARRRMNQLREKLLGRGGYRPERGLRTAPSYSQLMPPSGASSEAPISDPRLALLRFSDQLGEDYSGPIVVILSTTQLIESEGQRPTRLALALARHGIPVVFSYWRWDSSEWVRNERMDRGIVQIPVDIVVRHPEDLFDLLPTGEHVLYLTFPYPACLDLVSRANAAGWIVQYDLMDDWSAFADVGQAPWYDPGAEDLLIHGSDLVTAVSSSLQEAAQASGRPEVILVPNAAERSLLRDAGSAGEPEDDVVLGYFGYLSPAWFDWDVVYALAERRPSWRVDLIGYGGGPRNPQPNNVHFYGKQPFNKLPTLASDWSVGLVPFKVGPVAHASDPIKVYEYMALGLPVVGSGFIAPHGAENFVSIVETVDGYLEKIEELLGNQGKGSEEIMSFARQSTWDDRVDQLLSVWKSGAQRIDEKRWMFGR